jgi:hypothetical protein
MDVVIDELVVEVRPVDRVDATRLSKALEQEIRRLIGHLVPPEWPRSFADRLVDEIEKELP